MEDRLFYEMLSVVEEISAGKAATYGQIARLERAAGAAGNGGSYPEG